MRKSERIRLLELQMVRLEMELDQTKYLIGALLELNNTPGPDIDAGKWYRRNMD